MNNSTAQNVIAKSRHLLTSHNIKFASIKAKNIGVPFRLSYQYQDFQFTPQKEATIITPFLPRSPPPPPPRANI